MSKKIKCVFIVGPTASGKTGLSIEIAKKFGGEIISADSMQVYTGVHIASAAPDEAEKEGIEHHLFEFLDLSEQFSVADYVALAKNKIREIANRGKLPVIVGGTGLYISSLLDNTKFCEADTDFELRTRLENEFEESSGEFMLNKLREFDADSANKLHPNDKKRIIRAFEIYLTSGKTATEANAVSHDEEGFIDPIIIGLNFNSRELLYERINKRVDIMLAMGLLEEAKSTFEKRGIAGAFQAIGHKEFYPYFEGKTTLEEAIETLKQQTRRYAKRQLTWFRRDERINWLYPDLSENYITLANEIIEEFLKEE